jgi:hypothetical protein
VPDEWRWYSFRSGLACASDGGDIVGPEKCHLLEAGWTSRHGRLASASAGDLPGGSPVIVSWHACGMLGDTFVAAASQC